MSAGGPAGEPIAPAERRDPHWIEDRVNRKAARRVVSARGPGEPTTPAERRDPHWIEDRVNRKLRAAS